MTDRYRPVAISTAKQVLDQATSDAVLSPEDLELAIALQMLAGTAPRGEERFVPAPLYRRQAAGLQHAGRREYMIALLQRIVAR